MLAEGPIILLYYEFAGEVSRINVKYNAEGQLQCSGRYQSSAERTEELIADRIKGVVR